MIKRLGRRGVDGKGRRYAHPGSDQIYYEGLSENRVPFRLAKPQKKQLYKWGGEEAGGRKEKLGKQGSRIGLNLSPVINKQSKKGKKNLERGEGTHIKLEVCDWGETDP